MDSNIQKTQLTAKSLVELIPGITFILVFWGVCDLVVYYKCFDIDIISFVSSAEILVCFTNKAFDLAKLFLEFLIGSAVFYVIITKTRLAKITYRFLSDNQQDKWMGFLITLSTLLMLFTIFRLFVDKCDIDDKMFQSAISFDLCLIGALSMYAIINIPEIVKANLIPILFIQLIVIALILMDSSYLQAKLYRLKGSPKLVSFNYNSHPIKSDSVLTYIGSSNDYVFMYNRRLKVSNVYKMENVDSLVFWEESK
jgi:hypothetical protein